MRLDVACVEQLKTRSKAQDAISEGRVSVNGKVIYKASFQVSDDDLIQIESKDNEFVSRGGYKLLGAIEKYKIELTNLVVLDVGASTGGFTDVCLKNGAKKVYALDVGHLQLDSSLEKDVRVIKMEGHNAREIVPEWFDEKIDFLCMDVSFISCKTILSHIFSVMKINQIAILVKPQFECGPKYLNKHGVLKNKKLSKQIIEDVQAFILQYYKNVDYMESIITGRSGNQEYMLVASMLRECD